MNWKSSEGFSEFQWTRNLMSEDQDVGMDVSRHSVWERSEYLDTRSVPDDEDRAPFVMDEETLSGLADVLVDALWDDWRAPPGDPDINE